MNRKEKVVTRRMGSLGLMELRNEMATPLRPIQQDGSHIREEKKGQRRLINSRVYIQSSGSSKLSSSEVRGKPVHSLLGLDEKGVYSFYLGKCVIAFSSFRYCRPNDTNQKVGAFAE